MSYQYIRFFADISIGDVDSVGGKNASLGEMYSELNRQGVNIPNGFAITASAYRAFLDHNDLVKPITEALDALDVDDTNALAKTGEAIRSMIINGTMPEAIVEEIAQGYTQLESEYGDNVDVAVRSSATAEDLPDASFAGQQESHLNIKGVYNLLNSCRQIFASLFTNRAISYRVHQGFDHMSVALAIAVQKMVRSDKAASGVMFTIDTESGFRDIVFITGAWGLGENVVQGAVNPDEYYVFKPSINEDRQAIIKHQLGSKKLRMIYSENQVGSTGAVENVAVPLEEQNKFCLTDDEVNSLAKTALIIEKHYSEKAGRPMPMDIEWAKDGDSGQLFVVQARPETVESTKSHNALENHVLEKRGETIIEGKSVGSKVASGPARVIINTSQMSELQPGEILVTDITDPDWEPVMKIAGAIVTNRGGRTCHAAIIARELGIAAIVSTNHATDLIKTGDLVTVSCADGDTGTVYKGELPHHVETIDIDSIPTPEHTGIMLNLANPEVAFKTSMLPNSGVGLARMEFIINNSIGVHPNALIEYDQLPANVQSKIAPRLAGYSSPIAFYKHKLSEGIATIAASFYPKKVVVRLSDFKSNEYANLIGGSIYEPTEENPMLGFRGATRYLSESFSEAFALECEALRYAREKMGLDNIVIMIPFARTVEETKQVIELMESHGLKRGEKGLQIYLMCEIPANVILADQFLELVDGFSIGSNDLTQLTLGADRDSSLLGHYDERNEAVLRMLEMAIAACKRAGKYVGICGQAPSDFPEITKFLVEHGVSTVSVNPDSVVEMAKVVADMESKLG